MVDVFREPQYRGVQMNEWYMLYEDTGYMLITKKRCKHICRHRRTCFKWDGHRSGHDFNNGCKRCAREVIHPVLLKMRDELMNSGGFMNDG